MKANLITITVLALVIATQLAAQQNPRYKLIDLGTFGGPNSSPAPPNIDIFPVRSLNYRGTFIGQADTSTPDPFPNFCFNEDCLVSHAFRWQNGVRNDLGALTDGVSSTSAWVSNSGLVAGTSENGEIDPLIPGFPELHAVLWKNDKILDLGTLDGANESIASALNSRGQVVGSALNTIPDANSMVGAPYQTRAFLWQNAVMQDLGTLPGGTDAIAFAINDRGQIMGQSYTAESAPPTSPYCSFFPLTQHGFFWENQKMVDIGTLGGSCAFTYGLNNRGQVVGQATTKDDQESHPFLWDHETITDLGTLGGTYGWANWINDAGEIVGTASPDGQSLIGFSWKDRVQKGLGTLNGDPCSIADAINSRGQVVGGSGGFGTGGFFPACETKAVEHAVLWDKATIVDLNGFVPPDSDLTLIEALSINDRGEIGGIASLPNGDQRAFLLVPCGPQETEECHDASAVAFRPAPPTRKPVNDQIRRLFRHRLGLLHKPLDSSTSSEPNAPGATNGTLAAEEGTAKASDSMPNSLAPQLLHEPALFARTPALACLPYGAQCRPGYHCCPGLVCVPASTRAYCL